MYTFDVRYARLLLPRAGHGSVSMYILTLWFLPSFAHYFKKPSAALDSIRIDFNIVEENLTFNALILSKHGLAWFREHVHPNFMILTIFRALFYEIFQQLWTAQESIWTVLKKI